MVAVNVTTQCGRKDNYMGKTQSIAIAIEQFVENSMAVQSVLKESGIYNGEEMVISLVGKLYALSFKNSLEPTDIEGFLENEELTHYILHILEKKKG